VIRMEKVFGAGSASKRDAYWVGAEQNKYLSNIAGIAPEQARWQAISRITSSAISVNPPRTHYRGHTLIEIAVVMAIIAILVGAAYPSYHQTVLKGRRIDATSSLLRIQLAQARYRTEHASYAARLDDLGWRTPALSERGFYQIKLEKGVNPAFGFLITAIPVPGSDQADDDCSLFVIDATGPNRLSSSAPSCWD